MTHVEGESTHEQIGLTTFPAGHRYVSEMFFREIEFLIQLSHPCIVRMVGSFLETRTSGAQIGMEFAANGSLREALDKSAAFLDDTGRAMIVVGVVVGMKVIHSQGVVHRNLKPANILLDGRGHPKIGDLCSSRLSDIGLTKTRGVGTRLYKAPEMYDDVDYTSAINVYAFSLILYEVLFGDEDEVTESEDASGVESDSGVKSGG